jgi:hypothetical protein
MKMPKAEGQILKQLSPLTFSLGPSAGSLAGNDGLKYMTPLKIFNVEAGRPTLDEARRLVIEEIRKSKRAGVRVLKIIHGYGASGKGGKLCVGLRKSFALRKKEGVIKDFIAGEELSIFQEATLRLLEAVPEFRGDSDLNATNEGVTVLWLK